MSQNYNNILDQFIGLAKWGQTAYRSGERSRDEKTKIRKMIFNITSRIDEDHNLSQILDESRMMIEDYVLDYGNPKSVPDMFYDHLDDLKDCLKTVDTYPLSEAAQVSQFFEMDLKEVIAALLERYIRVASKILRLSFTEKAPPMTLPSVSDLITPRAPKKDRFE